MITLRDDQNKAVNQVRGALRTSRRVLLQAPTGCGKTVMASYMIDSAASKQNVTFFICHRRELVDQTAKTFDKFGVDYSFVAAGYPQDNSKLVFICSIDSLRNRLDKVPYPKVCFWDEAHHLAAATWDKVQKFYDKAYHVGLSATPERGDGQGLDSNFDTMVKGPSVRWLIDQGYLADYRLFSVPSLDRSELHTRMGKYIPSEVQEHMDKPTITGDIVAHWKKLASDRLTIGFAASVYMSQKYVDAFRAAGISAVHLDAETNKAERKAILQAFARGEYQVVWNVGLFGEGFDVAANSGMDVTIGCVIDAAPTKSLGAWLQRCGRALRPQERPAIILDHAGNIHHGMPCEDRVWTLYGREVNEQETSKEKSTAIKQCQSCYAVHKPAPKCPECGYVYATKPRQIEEVQGELHEVDREAMRERQARGQLKTAEDLELYRIRKGYKPGYENHVLRARAEKDALRRELFNLSAAFKIGMTRTTIWKMKPKQLREAIATIRGGNHEKPIQTQNSRHF